MRTVSVAAALAGALLAGHPHDAAAEVARFRFVVAEYGNEKDGGMKQPEGVACDATGQVIVADTGNDRLLRFTFRDRVLTPGEPIRNDQLSAPTRVYFGSKGDIYALDTKRRRVLRLGADGSVKGPLSLEGIPAPSTIVPRSFALDAADGVYLLDVFGGRVLVLDPEGAFRKAIPLPADAGFFSDVAVDATGRVLVLDSVKRRLYVAPRDGTAFTALGGNLGASIVTMPTALVTGRTDLFVLEGPGSTIVSLGRDGTVLSRQLGPGRTEGLLDHPTQVCVSEGDNAFVADRGNSRLQVFGLTR
jgi:DNA-binding beta-propeller fold protein YncE